MGSLALVYVMNGLRTLQSFFKRQPFQYLGRISFSLYLVHNLVYDIERPRVMAMFEKPLRNWSYRHYDEGRREEAL